MRKMQMKTTISGTRGSGQPWPPAGAPLVVDDWEADQLIAGDLARPWPEDPAPSAPEPDPAPPQDYFRPIGAPETPPVQEPVPDPVPDAGIPPEAAAGGAPKPVQPKADWVAWAVEHGASEQEANEATKAQLMELYGDRT